MWSSWFGDLFEESSGDSITYEILIFSEILPSLFWWKCSTQLYWSKFIFYSLLALLYLNVQCRANSIWPMLLDESDGDRHFIVQGEWIGYLFKPSQLFWLFSKYDVACEKYTYEIFRINLIKRFFLPNPSAEIVTSQSSIFAFKREWIRLSIYIFPFPNFSIFYLICNLFDEEKRISRRSEVLWRQLLPIIIPDICWRK